MDKEQAKKIVDELINSPQFIELLRAQLELTLANRDHIQDAINSGLIQVGKEEDGLPKGFSTKPE